MSTTSERDEARQAAERVLGDGSVTIDLANPPSRDDLGVTGDRKSVFLERKGREPFDVTVKFRDGHTLTTEATVLGVETDGSGPPYAVTVKRDGLTLDDLGSAFDQASTELGLDPTVAGQTLDQARSTQGGDIDLIRDLKTGIAAPDELTIEPVVTAAEGHVSVSYLVRWDA